MFIICYDVSHMKAINFKQRKKLKALAHHIKPVVNIGKEGLLSGSISYISDYLEKHELIKIKFTQNKDKKESISEDICEKIKCTLISLTGNTLTVYKRSENPKNRQIKI